MGREGPQKRCEAPSKKICGELRRTGKRQHADGQEKEGVFGEQQDFPRATGRCSAGNEEEKHLSAG